MDPAAMEQCLRAYEHRIARIEETMAALGDRTVKAERWQSATEPVLDSLNERVGAISDECESNAEWIARQEGGMSTRQKDFFQITTTVGIIIVLIKLLLYHN